MKNLFFILLIMLFISCNKDDKASIVVSTHVDISVKDAKGNNLLNPNNPKSLNQALIKIIYEIKGKKTVFFEEHLDAPGGFSVFKHENEYRMRVFLNSDKNEAYPITYIQWNDKDTDTLKCKISRKAGNTICNQLWFNGKHVWQLYGSKTGRFLEIIK